MEKCKIIQNNTFKISAMALHETFELSAESYSVSDIQDYFLKNHQKKHKTVTNNPLIRIYM